MIRVTTMHTGPLAGTVREDRKTPCNDSPPAGDDVA